MSGRQVSRLSESRQGLFEPDVLALSELCELRGGRLSPEKRLMTAVLEDAVDCFRKYRSAKSGRRRRLFRDAERWLMYEKDDFVFSFESICDILEIDPRTVRKNLQEGE